MNNWIDDHMERAILWEQVHNVHSMLTKTDKELLGNHLQVSSFLQHQDWGCFWLHSNRSTIYYIVLNYNKIYYSSITSKAEVCSSEDVHLLGTMLGYVAIEIKHFDPVLQPRGYSAMDEAGSTVE